LAAIPNQHRRHLVEMICPAVSVQRELSEGGVVQLGWEGAPLETSTLMIWHAEKWCSPLLKQFGRLTEAAIGA
jgi:hypothetical protein